MKKFVFGAFIMMLGLLFAAFSFIFAALNPWDYNGITGLFGSLLGTQMLIPFIVSLIIMVTGLTICWYEAYRRK